MSCYFFGDISDAKGFSVKFNQAESLLCDVMLDWLNAFLNFVRKPTVYRGTINTFRKNR